MDNSHHSYGPVIWIESGRVVGPGTKMQKGQGISKPNKGFTWDPSR